MTDRLSQTIGTLEERAFVCIVSTIIKSRPGRIQEHTEELSYLLERYQATDGVAAAQARTHALSIVLNANNRPIAEG